MQRPASNRAWCDRWDELSERLLVELAQPQCEIAKVSALIQERRRLTTAFPVNQPGDPVVSEEEEELWLERALDRETRLASLAVSVRERLGQSLTSLKAGRTVRTRFDHAEAKPRVFNTQV